MDFYDIALCTAMPLCKATSRALVDQELHEAVTDGVPGDHRVRVRSAGSHVVEFKVGIVVQNVLGRDPLRQQAEDEFHRDSHVSDDRLPAKDIRPRGDPSEQLYG